MADQTGVLKWHSMDELAASALTAATASPNHVFQVPLSALPSGVQLMPGLLQAYVSHYITTQAAFGAVSAFGELAAVRTESELGKAYNFILGVSSDRNVYFAGPFKDFPAHHFQSSQAVPIAALFIGHPSRGGTKSWA